MNKPTLALCLAGSITLSGCVTVDDRVQQVRVERSMKAWLAVELHHFRDAAADLQRATTNQNLRSLSLFQKGRCRADGSGRDH